MSFDGDDVLDGDGYSEQLPGGAVTGGERPIHGIGLGQRIRRVATEEGMDLPIHPLDAIQAGLDGFAGGDIAPDDSGGEFGNGELMHLPTSIRQFSAR